MARVKLEQVRKVYDDGAEAHTAVHGIDLEVGDGELVVLVGPSGCGKSTTLRMIAGLESISAGSIWIGDRVVNHVPPKDRDIAMVFQSYALYPHMSVYENMSFALTLRKLPKAEIENRVRQAAEILGLQGVLERRPKQLSGGQRQRVAVGRAIVRQPQVFLFDEPLSNLDAKLRVQTRREIAKLHRELAATMVYVTHDQVEAMTLGDRIVVMHEGRVQQTATPLALYERPVNRFVAGFIGSPAMNFVSGTVARDEGLLRFRAEGDGLVFAIPEPSAGALASRDGKAIVLGIRPEHIEVAGAPGLRSQTAMGLVSLRLDAVEPMGNEIILYGHAGTHALTARVPPQPLPAPGDAVELAVDLGKLHFFDPDTEMVIAQPGALSPHPPVSITA